MPARLGKILLLIGLLLSLSQSAVADQRASATLDAVHFDQKLGAQVPLDLQLRDESGNGVRLGDSFGKRPVLLALTYYRCPMLCGLVLSGLLRAVSEMSFTAGQQFEIVIVSIDPRDTPELAAAKKRSYVLHYHRPGAEAGWHFLTSANGDAVKRLADAIGFHYSYDARTDQYAHPSGILALAPDGRISRYFYGIEYLPTHLRFGLIEAAAGKIGSPVDQLILRCYHYDAKSGSYQLVIWRLVQLTCLITALALALMLRPANWRRPS